MKEFIFSKLLVGKNKYALISFITILLLVFIIILPFDNQRYEITLHSSYYKQYYNELLIELLKILIPLGVLIISLEHDQLYLRNLTPTIGRTKLVISKYICYFILILLCFIFIYCYYVIILKLLNYYVLFDSSLYIKLINITFDVIIIFSFILLFARHDKKILPFIIIIIYLMTNYIYETKPSLYFFYILPFHQNYFPEYIYTSLYQTMYILVLFTINILYSNNESYS